MTEILIVYYSRQGATAELARRAARGVDSVQGCTATLRTVPPVSAESERPVKAVPDGKPGHWRAQFDLKVAGTEPVEMRLFLRNGRHVLSETWLYQYHPFTTMQS